MIAFRNSPKSDRPASFSTMISPSMTAFWTASSPAALARAMPMAKLSEGDTITMTGEVTLVHDDGTITEASRLRRSGDDARGTPRARRDEEGGAGTAKAAV